MGVKDLWSVLTPHSERKPISELRGKTVAIDLAGWVCESLNVVDYFVHPRHHLKNLFFRGCYLIFVEVTPVFILEGVAPKLKSKVIEKRNEIQFRGVKPKESQSQAHCTKPKCDKGRTRFNHVLKQCEHLLQAMGLQCIQAPGEAEAYCAFLNSKGLVDGVISQDSDCFAYGALRVYRNFSVSSQGALAAQGGAVDIYDINNICSQMDKKIVMGQHRRIGKVSTIKYLLANYRKFYVYRRLRKGRYHKTQDNKIIVDFGQNKVIVMALLSGCDYCPEGIGGVGRDSVLKLFNKYKNDEILKHIRSWRLEDDKYSSLEMRVDDKTICSNCGHIGRTQSHTKNGCGICRTSRGCDESLWKEERLALKAELTLRKKALSDPSFPSEEIIEEFLKQPKEVPNLQLHWRQPNMVKFIKQVGHLLQWPEIYCFQKFFPILTRWQVLNACRLKELSSAVSYVTPKEIIKKRVVKGVPSLELLWQDQSGNFKGLIPENQLREFLDNNPKGLQDIWSTVEPFDKVRIAYPSLVETFLKFMEKPKKMPKKSEKLSKQQPLGSLENLNHIIQATNDIAKSMKPKRQTKKCNLKPRLQMIDRFFKQKYDNSIEENSMQTSTNFAYKFPIESQQCSTPITKSIPSDLESDIDDDDFEMSDIVNRIVGRSYESFALVSLKGKQLRYETKTKDGVLLGETFTTDRDKSVDDFDIPSGKRSLSNSFCKSSYKEAKLLSLDDSFDVLVKKGTCRSFKSNELTKVNRISNFIDRFKQKQLNSRIISETNSEKGKLEDEKNVSYFLNNSFQLENEDVFEKLMETSIAKQTILNEAEIDFIVLSD